MGGVDCGVELAITLTDTFGIESQHQDTGTHQLARQLHIQPMRADPVLQASRQQDYSHITATLVRACDDASQDNAVARHFKHILAPAHANHSTRQSVTALFSCGCNGSCRRGSNQNGRVSSDT